MAETTKSVLFVDYDSIHRSLAAGEAQAADRLASRIAAWVAAIENGRIFASRSDARRRILMRRCYADPALLGGGRSEFLSNGFQVVDCPPAEGRERNSAAIHMVLDTIDALEHPTAYEEFVLLSADTDLSPVLIRLRAHNRSTAIYANAVTAESYKAIADAMVDEQRLISLLLSDEEPGAEEEASGPPAERSEVEALARKISAATNVPLFAPRTFAELFRHLVEEIAENGYHFQTTAENVATRMGAAGRNVTRRQVVFVVKGLALKGHVFSTSDTPERLAEVFREQVFYLAENGGLTLDEKEKSVLPSWIVGRAPPASPGAQQETEIQPAPAAETPASNAARATGKSAEDQPSRSRRKQPKVTIAPKAEAAPPPAPRPAPEPAKPVAEVAARPAPAAPKPEPKPVPARVSVGEKAPQPPPRSPTAMPRPLINPVKPNPAVPSSPAATPRPASPLAAGVRPPPISAPRTPPTTRPPATTQASDADKEAVESSILAAIAQAVDVLVEDSGGKTKLSAPTPPKSSSAAPPEKKPPASPPAEEVPSEGDDIGDEIQRIIASYNRNRGQDERR
jgi:hypothetical protein